MSGDNVKAFEAKLEVVNGAAQMDASGTGRRRSRPRDRACRDGHCRFRDIAEETGLSKSTVQRLKEEGRGDGARFPGVDVSGAERACPTVPNPRAWDSGTLAEIAGHPAGQQWDNGPQSLSPQGIRAGHSQDTSRDGPKTAVPRPSTAWDTCPAEWREGFAVLAPN